MEDYYVFIDGKFYKHIKASCENLARGKIQENFSLRQSLCRFFEYLLYEELSEDQRKEIDQFWTEKEIIPKLILEKTKEKEKIINEIKSKANEILIMIEFLLEKNIAYEKPNLIYRKYKITEYINYIEFKCDEEIDLKIILDKIEEKYLICLKEIKKYK